MGPHEEDQFTLLPRSLESPDATTLPNALPGDAQAVDSVAEANDNTLSFRGDTPPRSDFVARSAPKEVLPEIPGYEVLNYLAKGGMGVVYRARDKTLDRIVALKMPRAGYVSSDQERERFLREARSAARLRHPHICPIYEVKDLAGQQPYICLAFIDGATLRGWNDSQQRGPRQVAEIMALVARAVQFAHDQGVIHRDLKPSNVMVEAKTGSPMLMDFGLAKDLSQNDGLTMSGDLLGTPAYMAPEQAAGKAQDVGPAADIYSLGAMLYELLAGQPPFIGSLSEVLQQVQYDEPLSVRRRNSQIHRDLETICVKAMAKRVNDRYASAAQLADDLDRFARGDAILARRQNPWQRGWRRARKYPVVTGLAATLALVLVAVSLVTPKISRTWQATRSISAIQASLAQADWTPKALLEIDDELVQVRSFAPATAEELQQQIAGRIERYVTDYLRQGRLSEADRQQIDAALLTLDRYAPQRATELRRATDRRFGLWERVVDIKAPFTNVASVQESLPEAIVAPDGQSLMSVSNKPMLSRQGCERNFQIEAGLLLQPKAHAGVILNAHAMHGDEISAVAIAPNQTMVASGAVDGELIFIWDARTGDELFRLQAQDRGTSSLVFTPDSQSLASCGRDGVLRLWSVEHRKLLQSVKLPMIPNWEGTEIFCGPPLLLSEDGGSVFVGIGNNEQGNAVLQYSLPDLSLMKTFAGHGLGIVHLAADLRSQTIVSATVDGDIQVWDANNGALRQEIQASPKLFISALAMSPQGDQIAVAYISGLVRILSLKTLLEVARLQGFEAGCYSLAFDPTGRTLAAGYENGTIKFWDVQRQVVTGTLADRRRRCLCLAYAPSGEWGISANAAGTLQIWDAATATERFSWSSQNYSFVLERAQDQNAATLSICRGQAILREQKLSLRSGITHMIARREGEQLHVQVDEHPPLVFHDYFPPRAIEKGVWGLLLLNGAKCDQLVVRRSLANNSANALQQGDEQFRLGRFAAALDAYAEQLSESATEENNRTRQEALLMSAFCFLRLNRSDDASRILKELARSKEATAPVIQAKFQLWSLLLLQGKAAEADALFQTIRLEHPLSQLSDVISADLRMDIFHIYHHSLARRRNLLQSGVVERLESLLEIAKYFELDERALDGVRWQIVSALRLVDRQEETLPHLRRLQQVNEQSLQSLTVLNTMDGLNRLKRRGFVDRALGQPTHSLASLTALFDRTRNVATAATTANNKSNVGWIEAIELELARTLAAEQRWQEVAERLQPMVDGQPQLLEVLVDSGLLLGFAHRHLGNSEQATMAWQGAANKLPANSVADADLYQDIELVPRLMWLRGLSGKLSADEFQRDLRFLQTRLASMPGTDRILDQFPLNVSMFTQCCHSQPGYANIERAACGNLTITEEVRGFLVVTAYQMIMDGAFGNAASEDQREFALQLTQSGFRAYAENQLSLPIFLQLGMAWKGVPAPLGWQFLFSGIPEPMRPGTAYLLGKRFERKQNLETAKTLWQLAKEQAAPDSLVHRLTTAEL